MTPSSLIRPADLVRLKGHVGVLRVRSTNFVTGKVTLAQPSGHPAGEWDVALVTPLATPSPQGETP